MKITKITQQIKHQNRVNIFLNDEFAFGLDKNLLVDFDLYKDRELTQDEINQILRKDLESKIRDRVIELISRRPRSEFEACDYIKRKFKEGKYDLAENYWEPVIENVIDSLKKVGYLDDKVFSRWYIDNRKAFKPRGKMMLSGELRQKGVEKSIVDEVLGYSDDEEIEMAKRLLEKKLRVSANPDKQKLIAFLQRKGFKWDVIKKVIDED